MPQLAQISGGVGGHLLLGELHPRGALAGGITNPRREIADDQYRRVARVLEGPQFAEEDAVAQMDVAAGGVDAQLYPQRPAFFFGLGQPGRQGLIRITGIPGREQVGHAPRQPIRQRRDGVRHGEAQ